MFDNISKKAQTEPVIIYTETSEKYNEMASENNNIITFVGESDAPFVKSVTDKTLIEHINEIRQNQKTIIENQERLAQRMESEFTQQKATYDKVYKMLKEVQNRHHNTTTETESKDEATVALANKFKFPLITVNDVFAFNKELDSNEDYRNYLIKSYMAIKGNEGNEEGKIIAKKLRTIFFTEHVLTYFSWTGIRTPGVRKKESFHLCEAIKKTVFGPSNNGR